MRWRVHGHPGRLLRVRSCSDDSAPGLAYTLTGNPHDAWDLGQETFERVGVRWRRLRHENPAAYARTVMVRLNIDRIRRLRRELPVVQLRDRESPRVDVGGVDPWLVAAIADLSPRQRTALALRFVEDLDVAQIASSSTELVSLRLRWLNS